MLGDGVGDVFGAGGVAGEIDVVCVRDAVVFARGRLRDEDFDRATVILNLAPLRCTEVGGRGGGMKQQIVGAAGQTKKNRSDDDTSHATAWSHKLECVVQRTVSRSTASKLAV